METWGNEMGRTICVHGIVLDSSSDLSECLNTTLHVMIPFALFSLHLRKFLFGMFWKTDEKILNGQILNSVEEIIFPFKKR